MYEFEETRGERWKVKSSHKCKNEIEALEMFVLLLRLCPQSRLVSVQRPSERLQSDWPEPRLNA